MQKIDKLRSLTATMTVNAQNIAMSLITQFGNRRSLTDKQWALVDKLIAENENKAPAQKFPRVHAFLAYASSKGAKNPTIHLGLGEAGKVVLNYAKKSDRVYIVDAERTYYDEKEGRDRTVAYGFLTNGGELGTYYSYPKVKKPLLEKLEAFEADPHKAGALEGHITGHCCFCTLKLTHPESVKRGYGPKCASYYGLPWKANGATTAGNLFDAVSGYNDLEALVESIYKDNPNLIGDEPISMFIADKEKLNQYELIGDEPIAVLRRK